mmetsp:Transcript_4294/g.12513  ORF Transcript_4294/g.12513 Transcript_4294/m.12513 type:complete len:307 (-) Transcript_4294:192-1112(-)
MMHPGAMVQFELDYLAGDAALSCRQCRRPLPPNSKNASRLPRKLFPPLACGMTMFGGNNQFSDVSSLATRHNASLVIVLRRDHLAHAVSSFLHFSRPPMKPGENRSDVSVPWNAHELRFAVDELSQSYDRLTMFPNATGRPAHFIFYEDLKRRPRAVWARLQEFLGLPAVDLPEIQTLERRSTSKPSELYLERLSELRRDLNGTALGDALAHPGTAADKIDLGREFAGLCARFPGARMSWRLGRCEGGRAVLLPDAAAAPSAGGNHSSRVRFNLLSSSWAARLRDVTQRLLSRHHFSLKARVARRR